MTDQTDMPSRGEMPGKGDGHRCRLDGSRSVICMQEPLLHGCEFRRNPAGDSDLMSATVPI